MIVDFEYLDDNNNYVVHGWHGFPSVLPEHYMQGNYVDNICIKSN